jgi:hypothetical protein
VQNQIFLRTIKRRKKPTDRRRYHLPFINCRGLIVFALFLGAAFLTLAGLGAKMRFSFFGGTDINLVTGAETYFPKQSTSSIWGHGNTIVVVYGDTRGFDGPDPDSVCGVSTSTDGGVTFSRLPETFDARAFCNGQQSVFYSVAAAKWYTHFRSTGCGDPYYVNSRVGQYESLDGITWVDSGCVASSGTLDLPSSWVDNNPASAFYGRQYAVFNDFDLSGAVRTTYSADHGATWSSPVSVFNDFLRRAVKIFGSPGPDGTVYIQTMDEGGGGLDGLHQNFIHRSTDGGVTWSAPISQGAAFLGPGRARCSGDPYFSCMYPTGAEYGSGGSWKEMGWGQPAAGPNGVVHYAYAGRPASGGDPGNIYYIRSTDFGISWSAPIQLNTDSTTRAQWGASLSANVFGHVFVSWYDERNTTNTDPASKAPTLERFSRASTDSGATWSNDMTLSDVVFPVPFPFSVSVRMADVDWYNHAAFSNDGNGATAYHAWTDGRVSIGGNPQQDVFFDKVAFAPMIVMFNGGSTIVSAGANGVVDPGETITVSLGVKNTGGPGVLCTTATLNGTLQATGGITNPTPVSQNYGVICSGDPPVFRNFTFTVSPSWTCGVPVTASLVMTDGTANYGTLSFNFATGILPLPAAIEYLDNVSAPALPSGWTTTFSGSGNAVTTSTNNPDSAPNSLFFTEAAAVGLSEVTSAVFAVPSSLPRLTFKNLFNTEAGYDGEVLEISINGGAFIDILAAGGSFVSGGYNTTLSSCCSNPLPGRQAWSGLSGGTPSEPAYITSVINLPAAAAGQNIQIRWRVGSDDSVVRSTNPGVQIDTIAFQSPFICAPVPQSAVSRKAHGGINRDISLPLGGNVGVECRSGGATNDHQVLISFADPVSVIGSAGVQAAVTSGTGAVGSGGVSNGGAVGVNGSVVTVPLTNVASAQRIEITLFQVNDGTNSPGDASISMGVLIGDTTGNGAVNASDVAQTKSRSGQVLSDANFRSDVTVSGQINSSDVSLVKSKSGTALP